MKLRKLLISTALITPAVVAPIGAMTSCSCTQAWGNLTPYTIGSADKNSGDNPYKQVLTNDLLDKDGIAINSYIQSNYVIDVAKSVNYAFTTPVASRTNNDGGTFTYNDGNCGWYSSTGHGFNATFKDKDNKDATCHKNVNLGGNIGFTTTIGQFINRYITLALNYQLTQLPTKDGNFNDENYKVAWGGTTPVTIKSKDTNRDFMEWIFSNANAHANGAVEAMMKTTSTNFNYINMPIPAYNADHSVSNVTKTLLIGTLLIGSAVEPGSANDEYYTNITDWKDGKRTITYESVPVVVRTTNLTQRWINPKIKDTFQISAYYEYKDGKTMKTIDKSLVQKKVGNAWSGMSNYVADGQSTKPENKGFKLAAPTGKDIKTACEDDRVTELLGTDFVAFVTYTYVQNRDGETLTPAKDTVTLSNLQAIMPAYMFTIKTDLYKYSHDNKAKIVNTDKVNTYCNELLEILNRSSKEGKKPHAKDLSDASKDYLHFLNYIFGGSDDKYTTWLTPTSW